MFIRTTAINKIRSLKQRIKVIQGGTSSGKTYAIIPILIDRACKENQLKITVVAETLPAVKEGAMDIFKTIMLNTNRWIESNWNASTLTYTFGGTKSRIQFKSFDSEGKAKASGKRDILFLNEANHISFSIADALMIRSKETYIDYNPDNEFWVHNEILTQPNSEFLLLTYHDNEGLPPETLEDLMIKKSKAFFNPNLPDRDLFLNGNIKNTYWSNWWRVYGLGEVGSLEGVIFNNWKIIPEIPTEAKYVRSGLDFGFTNDPTALIDKWEIDSVPVYDEVFYEKELTNSQIASKSKDIKRFIIADSAEPKSIKELKNLGLKVDGADKGKDSINFGIQQIQNYSFFYVTARSLNLISELRKYKWATDKQGSKLNIPIDDFNHCIDPIRYIETYGAVKPKLKVRSSRSAGFRDFV